MHTVKPLDQDAVINAARKTGAVVTAEEHNILGGLGGAVAECLSESRPTPLMRVGVADRYGASSRSYSKLLDAMGLTPEAIRKAVHTVIGRKRK